MHDLAAPLLDRLQRDHRLRQCESRFFVEFASRCGFGRFVVAELAFGDRPCAVVLALPERSAGVDEKALELAPRAAIRDDSGTLATRHLLSSHFLIEPKFAEDSYAQGSQDRRLSRRRTDRRRRAPRLGGADAERAQTPTDDRRE